MLRAGLVFLLAPILARGGDDVVIPEASSPRVYTEPHRVLAGDDWYWMRFPLQYSPRRPAPLLILLHDREEGDADQGKAAISGPLAAAFHERGWIVAAPTMMKRHRPTWADAGDYLVSLARRLRRAYPLSAVLLAGTSAGASAAMEHGLKNSWEFDGLAAFGGGAPRAGREARRLPLLISANPRDEHARDLAAALREQGFEDVTLKGCEGPGRAGPEAQAADAAAWAAARMPAFLRRRELRAEHIRAWKPRCVGADDWLALGEWCRTHAFETEALEAFEKAVQASPDFAPARQALGHVRVGDRWLSRDELERNPALSDGREIRRLSPSDRASAQQACERDLVSTRPEARQGAALSLGMLAQEPSIHALLRALRAETEAAVIPALQDALVRLKPRTVAAELQKWAGDPKVNLEEKARALEVIERLPVEAAFPAALAFYFADEAARPAARCVLAGGGEPALSRLAPLLGERNPRKLALVLDAAGEIRSRRAAPALVKFLDHSDARAREAARGAILKLGEPAVPHLVEALDGQGREPAADLLYRITGEKRGDDKQKWLEWIRHHRAEIDPPDRP